MAGEAPILRGFAPLGFGRRDFILFGPGGRGSFPLEGQPTGRGCQWLPTTPTEAPLCYHDGLSPFATSPLGLGGLGQTPSRPSARSQPATADRLSGRSRGSTSDRELTYCDLAYRVYRVRWSRRRPFLGADRERRREIAVLKVANGFKGPSI